MVKPVEVEEAAADGEEVVELVVPSPRRTPVPAERMSLISGGQEA